MAKKKKKSPDQLHRQVQDSLLVLPKYIEQQKKEGKRIRAFFLRYFSGPMLKLMNKALSAKRYRGTEGGKKRQTEQMKRHLEHKEAAIRHVQTTIQQQQKRKKKAP